MTTAKVHFGRTDGTVPRILVRDRQRDLLSTHGPAPGRSPAGGGLRPGAGLQGRLPDTDTATRALTPRPADTTVT